MSWGWRRGGEGAAIMLYLCEKFPEKGFLPTDPRCAPRRLHPSLPRSKIVCCVAVQLASNVH